MLFTAWIFKGYVIRAHLQLPDTARFSRTALHQYCKNLPEDASVSITTLNLFSVPRITHVKVSELYRYTVGCYRRDAKSLTEKRPWWMGKPETQFFLSDASHLRTEPFAWVFGNVRNFSQAHKTRTARP
jgi:hypothetical protein